MFLQNKKVFLLSALLLAGLHLGHASYALAQDADDEEEAREQMAKQEALKEQKRKAPPTAIPGAEASNGDMGHANMDIQPTLALFDAINRGSILAAKEAISRGADLKGRNILGQTPLDMAIDLNRNDIMFLLLSLRSAYQGPAVSKIIPLPPIDKHPVQIEPIQPKKIVTSKPDPEMGFLGF